MKRFFLICLFLFSINSKLLLKNENDEETFPEPIQINNEETEEIEMNLPFNPSDKNEEQEENKSDDDNDDDSNEYPDPIIVNDEEEENPNVNDPFEKEEEESEEEGKDYINFTEKYASITF